MASHALRINQLPVWGLPRGLAIATRYLGPTDTKGGRIVATCRRDCETTFRAVVPYSHDLNALENHHVAALECLARIEAQNEFYSFRFQAVASTADGYIFTTDALARPEH
jgi:hypothetical protein